MCEAGVGTTKTWSARCAHAQVVSVYRQILKREPSDAEVEAQLTTLPDLDTMLRVALDSEEYAVRLAEAGSKSTAQRTLVNVYHPDLAAFGYQPGSGSADGN